MKYTTLLFDLDDTLMDFGKAEDNAITLFYEKYGIPATQANKQLYSQINISKWKALEKGEITRAQLFYERFSELFDSLGVKADVLQANDDYLSFMAQSGFVFEGAEEICRDLRKHFRMYIITNGAKKAQQGRLSGISLTECFDGIFISEEIGYNKPHKAFFDYVFDNISEKDKAKCLVIGDSLSSDIAGAVNYGVDCCWLNKGEKREHNATYEISSLEELYDILIT